VVDWQKSRICKNGNVIADVDGIPLCFAPEVQAVKITADPGYPLPYAIEVALDLGRNSSSFEDSVNRLYDRRTMELGASVEYERNLVLSRRVGAVANSISDACAFLDIMEKPFPGRDRVHIEIGTGMGFGLAASAKSYFGDNVIGLDLSPHYLVMSRLLLAEQGVVAPKLVCADICDGWPIPLDQYDIGFISFEGVLEHIKNLDAFFGNIRKINSFPFLLYLTVPYSYTLKRESHFNLRGITWLPKSVQDRYIAWRLGVDKIDHVEFYSESSLRKALSRYFNSRSIKILKNSRNISQAHYLRCVVYVENSKSFA
jgi:hypothetical protein